MKGIIRLTFTFLNFSAFAQKNQPLKFTNLFFTQPGDGISCYKIPSLVTTTNGDLIAANMTIKISYDKGKTWSKGKTIYAGSAAYSSITVLINGDIGLFFENKITKKMYLQPLV